jgi:hypothetical protein
VEALPGLFSAGEEVWLASMTGFGDRGSLWVLPRGRWDKTRRVDGPSATKSGVKKKERNTQKPDGIELSYHTLMIAVEDTLSLPKEKSRMSCNTKRKSRQSVKIGQAQGESPRYKLIPEDSLRCQPWGMSKSLSSLA